MELLTQHLGQGLMLSLMLSLPAVLTAAGIGLVVGILQAVTQVQEQTIAAAPKILGVFAIIIIGGGLMMTMLENYTRESVQIAFNEIPQDGEFILPPATRQSNGQARAREFFQIQAKNGMNPDRLRDFAAKWGAQEDSAGLGGTFKANPAPKKDSALGISEKMALEKDRKR